MTLYGTAACTGDGCDPDGHLERADRWQARRYCSRACSNAVTADLKRLRNAARRRSRDRADVS